MLTVLLLIQLAHLRLTDADKDEEINFLCMSSNASLTRTRKHAKDLGVLNFYSAYIW